MSLKWNGTALQRRDPNAEPEGEVDRPEDFDCHASLKILAKDCADILQRKYPGWRWAIGVNRLGHMLNIFNLTLHNQWGYTIRTMDIEHDPKRKACLIGGGEILERFGFRRGPVDWARVAQMKRDARGNGIPILSDLEHAAARKELRRRALSQAIQQGSTLILPDGRLAVGVAR